MPNMFTKSSCNESVMILLITVIQRQWPFCTVWWWWAALLVMKPSFYGLQANFEHLAHVCLRRRYISLCPCAGRLAGSYFKISSI